MASNWEEGTWADCLYNLQLDVHSVGDQSISCINYLSMNYEGTGVITSADDAVAVMEFDRAQNEWNRKHHYSRKHGAEMAQFIAGSASKCVVASKYDPREPSAIRIWDLAKNRFISVHKAGGPIVRGTGLRANLGINYFIAATLNGNFSLFNASAPKAVATSALESDILRSSSEAHRGFCPCVAFNSVDPFYFVAVTTSAHVVRILDLRKLESNEFMILNLSSAIGDQDDWIRTLDFTPSMKLLVTTAKGGMVIINLNGPQKVRKFELPQQSFIAASQHTEDEYRPLNSLHYHTLALGIPAVSGDETIIAMGARNKTSPDGSLYFWNIETQKLVKEIHGFFDVPHFLAFHPSLPVLFVADNIATTWIVRPDCDEAEDQVQYAYRSDSDGRR